MDRRVFILATLATAGCGLTGDRSLDIVCDPGLEIPLARALAVHGIESGYSLTVCMPQEILRRVEGRMADLVVTREGKIADRLQRLGQARLNDRWTASILGVKVQILATRDGDAHRKAVALGEWLSGDEAARHLAMTPTPILFTAP